MADVTRQRTGEILRKLFEFLKKAPNGLPAGEALGKLKQTLRLTPYEAGEYESGGRRFDKIVRFATVDCVKAGWMQKAKGRWYLTDAGWEAYRTFPDPASFYSEASRLYRVWKASQPVSEMTEALDSMTTGEREVYEELGSKAATITYDQAEEQAWSEIRAYLLKMPPYDFQELVAALLRAMGHHVTWIAPPGKDGGVDIIALPDPLGTRPPRIKVQIKRQQKPVPVGEVRSFISLLGAEDVGLFVSTGDFTKGAGEEARAKETRRLTLINLEALFDLWVEYYSKLTNEARQRLPLKPIYFLSPEP